MKKIMIAMAVCAMFVACGGSENKGAKDSQSKPTKSVEERAEEYVEKMQNAQTVGEVWEIQKQAEDWARTLSPENQRKAARIFDMYAD
jgi:hypothetical protein